MNALKAAVRNLVSLEDVAMFRNDMNTLLSTRTNELTSDYSAPHSLQLQNPLIESSSQWSSHFSSLPGSQVSQPFQRFQPLKPQTVFHVIEQSRANEVSYPFPLPSSARASTLSSHYTPLHRTTTSCRPSAGLVGGGIGLGGEVRKIIGLGAEERLGLAGERLGLSGGKEGQRKCARTDVRACASSIQEEDEDDEGDEEEDESEEEEEKDEDCGGSASRRGDEGITWLFEPEEDEVPKGNITLDDFITGEKEIVYNQDESDEKLIKEIMCANTNMSDISDEENEITLDDLLPGVCGEEQRSDNYFKLGSP